MTNYKKVFKTLVLSKDTLKLGIAVMKIKLAAISENGGGKHMFEAFYVYKN